MEDRWKKEVRRSIEGEREEGINLDVQKGINLSFKRSDDIANAGEEGVEIRTKEFRK